VPVQPLLLKGKKMYSMFEHWTKYPWVLPVYEYESIKAINSDITQRIIEPAERKLLKEK
jgi:hypothetical protein